MLPKNILASSLDKPGTKPQTLQLVNDLLHLVSYSQAPNVKVYWKDCCSDAHTQINKTRGGVHPGHVPVSVTASQRDTKPKTNLESPINPSPLTACLAVSQSADTERSCRRCTETTDRWWIQTHHPGGPEFLQQGTNFKILPTCKQA